MIAMVHSVIDVYLLLRCFDVSFVSVCVRSMDVSSSSSNDAMQWKGIVSIRYRTELIFL